MNEPATTTRPATKVRLNVHLKTQNNLAETLQDEVLLHLYVEACTVAGFSNPSGLWRSPAARLDLGEFELNDDLSASLIIPEQYVPLTPEVFADLVKMSLRIVASKVSTRDARFVPYRVFGFLASNLNRCEVRVSSQPVTA